MYSLMRPLRAGLRRMCWMSRSEAGIVRFVVGDALGDALVRPGRVVVRLVFSQDGAQVLLADDQHAVQVSLTRSDVPVSTSLPELVPARP